MPCSLLFRYNSLFYVNEYVQTTRIIRFFNVFLVINDTVSLLRSMEFERVQVIATVKIEKKTFTGVRNVSGQFVNETV